MGEAPGAEEERLGAPFVGPSGQLLQRMLFEAEIPWKLVYRTNVLPWRPPGNRTPYPFEIQASWERLHSEISVISPRVVICAGSTAWSGVTRDEAGRFTEARWNWHEIDGRRVLAVPHPSRILQTGEPDRTKMTLATVRCLAQCFEPAQSA